MKVDYRLKCHFVDYTAQQDNFHCDHNGLSADYLYILGPWTWSSYPDSHPNLTVIEKTNHELGKLSLGELSDKIGTRAHIRSQ